MKTLHSYRLSRATEQNLKKLKEMNEKMNETEILEECIKRMRMLQQMINYVYKEKGIKKEIKLYNQEDMIEVDRIIEKGIRRI